MNSRTSIRWFTRVMQITVWCVSYFHNIAAAAKSIRKTRVETVNQMTADIKFKTKYCRGSFQLSRIHIRQFWRCKLKEKTREGESRGIRQVHTGCGELPSTYYVFLGNIFEDSAALTSGFCYCGRTSTRPLKAIKLFWLRYCLNAVFRVLRNIIGFPLWRVWSWRTVSLGKLAQVNGARVIKFVFIGWFNNCMSIESFEFGTAC